MTAKTETTFQKRGAMNLRWRPRPITATKNSMYGASPHKASSTDLGAKDWLNQTKEIATRVGSS